MEETLENKSIKLPRVWEIDFFRGVLMIVMIFDHLMYDWGYLIIDFFKHSYPYPSWITSFTQLAQDYWCSDWRIITRFVILALFFMISGISCTFSKNNLKRGLIILAVGVAITIASFILSAIINEDFGIFFGVLSCYGVAIISYWGFRKIFIYCSKDEASWKYISLIFGLLFIIIGLLFQCYSEIHYAPHLTATNFIAVIIGSVDYGADWMGLFPAIGYMFVGGFIGELLYNKSMRAKRIKFDVKADKITRPINFVGRHCVYFYIFHQVVLIGIMAIILFCNGYSLNL